jgi:hypothetical protein
MRAARSPYCVGASWLARERLMDMQLDYAKSSRRRWRFMAWSMPLMAFVLYGASYVPQWGHTVMRQFEASSQQRECEEYWEHAQGTVRISEEQSRRTTEFSSANTPECVRRYEEFVGSPMSYPIVFMGRVRSASGEEEMVIARLYVWNLHDVVFSLEFHIRAYSIATRTALPHEVMRCSANVDFYRRNPSDVPSFKAGYRDPNDAACFIVPCKVNGVDLPIEFKIQSNKAVNVKVPPNWPSSPKKAEPAGHLSIDLAVPAGTPLRNFVFLKGDPGRLVTVAPKASHFFKVTIPKEAFVVGRCDVSASGDKGIVKSTAVELQCMKTPE